jgi:hypothetical protein
MVVIIPERSRWPCCKTVLESGEEHQLISTLSSNRSW